MKWHTFVWVTVFFVAIQCGLLGEPERGAVNISKPPQWQSIKEPNRGAVNIAKGHKDRDFEEPERGAVNVSRTPREEEVLPDSASFKSLKDNQDYNTIVSYISEVFTKTRKEDAKLIASYLVGYGKKHNIDPKLTAALIAR